MKQSKIRLALLGFLLLLPGNNSIPLIDRDEPRFAQAAAEMVQRGEWVIPYFNNEYRFDKPVLTYWLMRGSYAVFGVNAFGARFHSVVAAVALALVLYAMGRRWFSEQAGLVAAVGWLTCLQVQIHGRAAVADMPMVLLVSTAMWAVAELLGCSGRSESGPHNRWFWTLYLSLGLGFLAKGPVALAVPLLALLLFRFVFWRKPMAWGNLKLHLGLPVTLAIIAAWGVPALQRTDGEFWRVGMVEHVIERGAKAFNARMFVPVYYPLTALASLFPWSFFLPAGWRTMRSNWDARNAFLVAWFVAPFIIFAFYATQLPHYILPAFPAFFLLLGQSWERVVRRRIVLAIAVLVVVSGIQAAGMYLRPRTPATVLQELFAEMPAESAFGYYRYREPSLVFYSHHPWETLHTLEEARGFAAQPGPRMLVMVESDGKDNYLQELDTVNAAGFKLQRVTGWNIARSEPVTLRVFYRR